MSGKPAARQGDMTQYGGSIVQGSAGVRIGAPTGVACSVCPGGVTSGHPVNPLLGAIMPKPDGLTAAKNLAEAFEHYNEWHPHSALGYRSPREYLRQQASNGLSDNRCLEI